MELSFHAVQILERLRNDIQTKGQRSLDDIRFRQHKIAQSEKREVTEKDFIAATAGDVVIAEEEACALFRELAGGGERMPFAEVDPTPISLYKPYIARRNRITNEHHEHTKFHTKIETNF